MKKYFEIRKNSYFDSVTLMSLSQKIKKLKEIPDAVISMGTTMNRELLKRVGLYAKEMEVCTENDLILAFSYEESADMAEILRIIDEKLKGGGPADQDRQVVYKTAREAKTENESANLAVISVPGEYAYREAKGALDQNMNVMIFSDNVTLEEELALKTYAHEKQLLVMGPDCGTVILGGKGLCFANKVRSGSIGVVGASGTGIQEFTVLADRFGGGISNAIGVGGRDLRKEIGAVMMIDGIRLLQKDRATQVITVISKLPDEPVREKLFQVIREEITKPVVVYFTTDRRLENSGSCIKMAVTLKDAARQAVELALHRKINLKERRDFISPGFTAEQKYIRGLYCGGTLCSEAYYFLRSRLSGIFSNVSKKADEIPEDVFVSRENTLLDLGDDLFTRGRPHPMIDPTIRCERIIQECEDQQTAVILLDFEIGYGSHSNPVKATLDAILEGKRAAEAEGRNIAFVTYVCGTSLDEQDKTEQEKLLLECGCMVVESNIDAVNLAYRLVSSEFTGQ